MKTMVSYIGYLMAIGGFAVFIWQRAVITEQRRDNNTHLEQRVTKVEKEMITKEIVAKVVAEVVDSVIVIRLAPIVDVQYALCDSYNALRGSYALFVKESVGSVDKFTRYLNGIQFELNIPRLTDTLKIKITKIEPDDRK